MTESPSQPIEEEAADIPGEKETDEIASKEEAADIPGEKETDEIASKEEAADIPGEKKIGMSTLAIRGAVALAVVGALAVLVVYVARWPEVGPQKANANIVAAVQRSNKLYERAQKLMANVVFTDAAGRTVTPTTSKVTSPEQIKLLPLTTPNPKALDDINQAVDGLKQALADNRSAGKDVEALAHKLLSRLLTLKGDYYTAKSLTDKVVVGNLLDLANQSIGVMQRQMAFIEECNELTGISNDDVMTIRSEGLSKAKDLEAKKKEVSDIIFDLANKVKEMRASGAALATKASAARKESEKAEGQKGVDLLDQALAYEKVMYSLRGKIREDQDRIRVLEVEYKDLGLREVSATERAEAAEVILGNRKKETADRLVERDECRKVLKEFETSAIDLMDKIVKRSVEVKTAEAEAVNAYSAAVKQLEEAKVGEPARYAAYEADKADIAMVMADLSVERLSLQERLRLLAVLITDLWPKLSPPRQVPPGAPKLATYVADVEKLRNNATTGYQNATELYSKAIKSADRIHRWVYQGQLAAAYMGLYRLSGDTNELKNADDAIKDALKDKESSPYLEPVLELRRLVRAEQGMPPRAPSTAPASTAPSTGL